MKRQKTESNCLAGPRISSSRSVEEFEKLNRIQEGSYGVVYRAKDKKSGSIVALKKLKLENEKDGFPITSIREIHTLKLCQHPNIVQVLEIVTTPSLNHVFIVMEFVEHDLKSLMEDMPSPFVLSEIKTLMLQLLSGIQCMHKNWIIHRDLKTSNLLMNNRGNIKIADFGLARRYGSPLGDITQLVVTLWYRAPELLLGVTKYSTAIDMWSVGCIFAELILHAPLFEGRGEIDQLSKIFQMLGTPNEEKWPGYRDLPNAKTVNFARQPHNKLRERFRYLSDNGHDLLSKFLCYDPAQRITAKEALEHAFFTEKPPPKDPQYFPTFPSKSAGK
jgi:cell division cycle 2-like protein